MSIGVVRVEEGNQEGLMPTVFEIARINRAVEAEGAGLKPGTYIERG